jgi:protease-4
MFAFVGAVGRDYFQEEVIQKGPSLNKIVVINLEGLIDEYVSRDICGQLKQAKEDRNVKGLIISVNSPGGLVSASDQIYNEILKYRYETGRPVVAFMHGLAASGGYYTSVACEKIVAEPTVITGSIGVILRYFVIQELLEGKLGIEPVVIKSGLKKDWPSLFKKPSEEQLKYLEDNLIIPYYQRFVDIVAGSRKALTIEEVRALADGSIYSADDACNKKLIDKVGYFDEAVREISSLAGLKKARIVEYRKPFSWAYLLNVKTDGILKIDKSTMHKLSTPEVLYLWSIY